MILTLEEISYKAPVTGSRILKNINLEVMRGDIVGLTGESGSGKTTLAKLITGLLTPASGSIKFNFRRTTGIRISPVQILFQNNGQIINPFRRAIDVIKETALKRYPANPDGEIDQIKKALEIPDDILNRRGLELSGGEQQRVALARVLAAGPELLLLDEPFAAQDPQSQLNLLKIFRRINLEYDITLICISHHTGILRQICRNMAVMYEGTIVEEQNTIDLFSKPRHPYTRYLISAEDYTLSPEELHKWRANN